MNDQVNIGVIRFSEDFTSAEKPSGEEIQFTRFEARALQFFSQNLDRLVTRAQLLDSVSNEGSDKNDRNIDFLVNRIRKKLEDSAQEPRFIATRYGEGYIWIGQSSSTYVAGNDSYLVIGPVRVAGSLAGSSGLESSFCQNLQKALKFRLSGGQRVTVDPNCPPASEFGVLAPEIGVEMTFFTDSPTLECIVTVRKFREAKILAMTRITVSGGEWSSAQEADGPQQLAEWILQEIWRGHASIESSGDPLPVAIQMASQSKKLKGIHIWEETDHWIRKLIGEHPDDPEIQLKYATHLHTKYVVAGYAFFKQGIDDRMQDEDEIERLVQKALPKIQSRPELAIMAAKLLFFLDRGYENFAADLAESAHRECTILTHSLPIIGQMRGFLGNIDHGIEAIDQAINLAEVGSQAHMYALVIKCNLQMAARDFDGLTATKKEFFHNLTPISTLFLEPLYANPDKPSLKARAAVMMLSKKEAVAVLLHAYYVSARLFKVPEHKENSMRTLVSLFSRRFGVDVISDEIAAAFPDLMRRYNR